MKGISLVNLVEHMASDYRLTNGGVKTFCHVYGLLAVCYHFVVVALDDAAHVRQTRVRYLYCVSIKDFMISVL